VDAIGAIARGTNIGLLGTFIAALFMSVLYYPMFWVAFALTSTLRQISKAKVREMKKPPIPFEETPLAIQRTIK
jgi:hypothetical protein